MQQGTAPPKEAGVCWASPHVTHVLRTYHAHISQISISHIRAHTSHAPHTHSHFTDFPRTAVLAQTCTLTPTLTLRHHPPTQSHTLSHPLTRSHSLTQSHPPRSPCPPSTATRWPPVRTWASLRPPAWAGTLSASCPRCGEHARINRVCFACAMHTLGLCRMWLDKLGGLEAGGGGSV